MPPRPTARHSRPNAKPAPAPATDPSLDGLIDDLPFPEEVAPAPGPAAASGPSASSRILTNRSSKRMATGRTSRRIAAQSATSQRIPVEPASPEEIAEAAEEHRGAVRSGLFIVAGAIGLLGIGFLVYVLVLKSDPNEVAGRSSLADAERALKAAFTQLDNRQPDSARAELAAAKAAFAGVPALPQLAQRRSEMKRELEAIQPKIDRVTRDVAVDTGKRLLQARLGKLGSPDVTDGEVARLEVDCQAFVKNPADPAAGPDQEVAKTYAGAVLEIQSRIGTVQAEIRRRRDQATAGQVAKVQGEIEPLVKQERFLEALDLIDKTARAFPGAQLDPTKAYVQAAAETAWSSVTAYVDLKGKDVKAPETTAQGREALIKGIHERLDGVISTWGISQYVDQARELRNRY